MKRFLILIIALQLFLILQAQTAYSELTKSYAEQGNYEKAIEFEKEGQELWERIHGKANKEYAVSLSNQALYNYYIANYSEAIKLETEAMRIYKEILGETHPDYAKSLANLASYNYYLCDYSEAIRLGTEAMNIRKEILGEKHPDYVASLANLSLYNSDLGNYSEAIRLETEAMNILKEILGEKHPDYAASLVNLSSYNSDLGNYSEAIRLGTEAMNILKEILGEKHPGYAASLSNLALDNYYLGNYSEAIRLGTEAMNIRKEILGEKHPDYAASLANLSSYNSDLGNYSEAIRLGTEALDIRKEILGEKHPDYAASLSNLANYNYYLGNYSEAIRLVTKAIYINKDILGEKHPDYATSLSNLASYNANLGNYSEAITLGTEAMNIRKEILGEKHPDYAASLSDLALYNSNLGNYSEAIRLGTEALDIRKEILGEKHPDYATSLSNLALDNYYLGNYSEAIRLGTEALDIRKEILGEKHPDYATSLSNLALYNSDLGNYSEAIRLGTEALYIRKEILGEKHPYYTISVRNLIYMDNENNENLNKYSNIVSSNKMDEIKYNFKYLPQNMRKTFWDKNKDWFENELPQFSYKTSYKEIILQSYNGILLSKGLLLNSEIEFDKFLAEEGSPELAEKYKEIKNLRLQLNKLYEKPIADRWCDTDSLERVANNLERELMYESKEFGDYTRNLSITWEDVRDNLKEKDAAIEFVHFPLNNDSTMYMAYVLRPGMDSPQMVKLFEEEDLILLIDADDWTGIYTDKSASDKVWGKLSPHLEGVENVYFAPDGILHQIAIEYLPNINGDGMISDKFNLHRLSSTREIALTRHNAPTKEAVVYGGIKYDTDTTTMVIESRKYERPRHRGFTPYYNLGDSLALRGSLEYLDGSMKEAENINGMMKDNNYNSSFLSGNDATEESFKNLSGKANGIIHISTHGFYWTESEAERKASHNERLLFMSQLGDNARRNIEDKALTRTGLFMAGAKNTLGGVELPEDVDDGILTAQEISNLDLRGLDLVVLSACQTGMGDISGDGVFGLQRGFKKAGANTILMSLWDVDDEATQILMTEFYKNYLGGKSKQQALREAQKTVRETPGFSEPEYWAAFILLDALN